MKLQPPTLLQLPTHTQTLLLGLKSRQSWLHMSIILKQISQTLLIYCLFVVQKNVTTASMMGGMHACVCQRERDGQCDVITLMVLDQD